MIAPARMSAYCSGVEQAERDAGLAEDERELADLTAAGRDDERGVRRVGQHESDERGHDRLRDDDEQNGDDQLAPVCGDRRRLDEHAHRDEEDHGERFAERQQVRADLVTERRLADDDAGDERAERERDAEERGRRERGADRDGQRDQHEQLARSRLHDAAQQQRHQPRADDDHERDEQQRLADAEQRLPEHARLTRRREHGQQHEDRDGREILEHEPADRDLAGGELSQPWSMNPRISTTVLATEIASPNTQPPALE